MKLVTLALLSTLSTFSLADEVKFDCVSYIKSCEYTISSDPLPRCENMEVLFTESFPLNCPDALGTDFPLRKFNFNKEIRLVYACNPGQILQLIVLDNRTKKTGRVIGFTAAPITTNFLNLFSTLAEENSTGDKRIIFDITCKKSEAK